jgi:hypothetical protein
MLGRIVTGLFVVWGWFALMYFSANLTEMFGSISRADQHLWSTRNGYLAFGFVVIVIGFLIMFGVANTQSVSDPTALQLQ